MEQLLLDIIENLNDIDIYKITHIQNETEFEKFVYNRLDEILDKKINLMTQSRTYKEGREVRPDIVIGKDDILIELKYDLKGINDIYRLYYQAIKYSKRANYALILCVHDPDKLLLKSDINDLESVEKVKVVQIY
ncbi:MAG: hypothetical protein ACFFG0_27195 [Candidatus Thorarchaeota archaeon]